MSSCANNNNNEKLSMYAGDTGPIKQIKFTDIDISGCSCQQALWKNLSDGSAAYGPSSVTETVTTTTGDRFSVYLPQGSTTGLPPGGYIWVIELSCSTSVPPLTREIHIPITINAQGIP